jgi:hypothetical protein
LATERFNNAKKHKTERTKKMKITALVIEDEVKQYVTKEGKPAQRRTLHLVDKDPEKRLLTMVKLGIPMDDKVAGPAGQASIRDTVITASISKITQFEWDKSLGFDGEVLRIEGVDRFEAAAQPAKK